jgi:hypothetical protein
MNRSTIEDPPALKLARLAVPLVAALIWSIWSGAAVAAEIKTPHSIKCKAVTVHGFQDVQAAKSWDVDDQLADSNLVFEWRPRTPEGPSIAVNGVEAQLASITGETIMALYGFSDTVTVKRWIYAINFRLENIVGANVESNIASLKGRAAEFSCDFEETH